jgi:hypothetical protein
MTTRLTLAATAIRYGPPSPSMPGCANKATRGSTIRDRIPGASRHVPADLTMVSAIAADLARESADHG